MVKLFSKNSNLCDHNSPTSQTDRRTTCDRNTALCTKLTKVHRAVKTSGRPCFVLICTSTAAIVDRLFAALSTVGLVVHTKTNRGDTNRKLCCPTAGRLWVKPETADVQALSACARWRMDLLRGHRRVDHRVAYWHWHRPNDSELPNLISSRLTFVSRLNVDVTYISWTSSSSSSSL